ncbi:MAG: S41 family peptidase [Bacteroidales bacterium]|nr:S41 family peptidase [Bacteroidales bacterium]
MKRAIVIFAIFALTISSLQAQNEKKKSKTKKNKATVEQTDTKAAKKDTSEFYRVEEVCGYINDYYVETPNYLKITEKAVSSMLAELDPHSTYIAAKDVERTNEGLQGNFEGVGISFQIVDDTISVTDVIVGGPSEKVGLQIGDKLLMVDDTTATYKGVNNTFVFNHLRGKKGTHVKLTVKRAGLSNPLVFDIVRDKVPIYSVDTYFMLDDEVGYLRLTRFARTSHREVREAISALKKKGMKRLVFDLRGNSGGYLDIAFGIANEFLDAGRLIVYTEGDKSPRQNYRSNRGGSFTSGPLVVLVDEYSASASEIVSGAVQDWDRATLVGRRTFGKGLVQRMFPIYDGAQIRLTTARYYTPSGRCIQKPYDDGTAAYNKDLQNRYLHNELINADSINFPDSLKFYTKSGRVVYGGGGIMPDVFVPMDTLRLSDYFLSLRSSGAFNTFALNWADAHRSDSSFATFDLFLQNYDSLAVAKEFAAFASTKDIARSDVKGEWVASWLGEQAKKTVADTAHVIHADSYEHYLAALLADPQFAEALHDKAKSEDQRSARINEHSDVYMGYLIKSLIARNLYGIEFYYRVMKDDDEGLQRAIQTVKEIKQ